MDENMERELGRILAVSKDMQEGFKLSSSAEEGLDRMREAGRKIAELLGVEEVEVAFALTALMYEESEADAQYLFTKIEDPSFEITHVHRMGIKAWIAMLMGAMTHMKLKQLGALPQLSPEKEAEVRTAAKLLRERFGPLIAGKL